MFWEVGSSVDCKTSQLVGLLMVDVLEEERKLKGWIIIQMKFKSNLKAIS